MSKLVQVRITPQMVMPEPPPPSVSFQYFVCKWKQPHVGYTLDWGPKGLVVTGTFGGVPDHPWEILIPVDPLTAMSLGAVTPEQLGFPPAICTTFNLLKD